MSFVILMLSFLFTLNTISGKTYIVKTGKEKEILKGEDFMLNRENSAKIKNMKDVSRVARSNDKFSMKLYDLLKKKEGNLIISPFSVSAVMAMVSEGARGRTRKQIRKGMSFPNSYSLQLGYQETLPALKSTDNFTLEAANTAFVKKGYSVLQSFQDILENMFHSNFQSVSFENSQFVARKINKWVEKITRKKIKDLISPDMLDSDTKLVLVNAIYFKGDWADKFDPELTTDKVFHVSPFTTVMVPMMSKKRALLWANLDTLSSNMVELSYKGDRIVMQVLLPRERNGLSELEEKLKSADIQDMFGGKSFKTNVNIQLPKFKLEQKVDLKDNIIDLGMSDMFSAGIANFSGISRKRGLYVSQVVQKAFIEVIEEGSEAAAANAVLFADRYGYRGPDPQFVADHPFIFYIRDKNTGMLLFQGRVVNPEI